MPSASARPKEDPDKYYKSPNSLHGKTVLIPIGSHIEGRMNQTISSRKSKRGERFSIEITSPVLANGSEVIIPIGSQIIGEVVEAIPARKVRRPKHAPKPAGKLRIQLSMIKTPDGVTYPMIASIAGEYLASGNGRLKPNELLNTPSLGYAGSSASFSAVHPSMNKRGYSAKRGPKVVKRRDYWKDPILGIDRSVKRSLKSGTPVIRSMVKKGRDLYIYSGSPLTVRIDAPLKIGIAPSKGRMSIDIGTGASPMVRRDGEGNYRRFQPVGRNTQASPNSPQQATSNTPGEQAQASKPTLKRAVDPEAHLPVFLRTPKNARFLKPAPFSNDKFSQKQFSKQQSSSQSGQPEPKPVKFSPSGNKASQQVDDF